MRLVIDRTEPARSEPAPEGAAGAARAASAIEVRGLTKTYGRVRALDDVSFEVPWGSVVGVLGLAGSGKTTLVETILGLTAPSAGSTTIAGRPLTHHTRPALLVGAALGADAFDPRRTARSQLELFAAAGRHERARVDIALFRTQLLAEQDVRIRDLSAGAKQRVAIAVALLGDPAVLVLDEPHRGMEEHDRRWLAAFLRDHAAGGGAALLTGGVVGELTAVADQLLVLDQGRVMTTAATGDAEHEGRRAIERAVS